MASCLVTWIHLIDVECPNGRANYVQFNGHWDDNTEQSEWKMDVIRNIFFSEWATTSRYFARTLCFARKFLDAKSNFHFSHSFQITLISKWWIFFRRISDCSPADEFVHIFLPFFAISFVICSKFQLRNVMRNLSRSKWMNETTNNEPKIKEKMEGKIEWKMPYRIVNFLLSSFNFRSISASSSSVRGLGSPSSSFWCSNKLSKSFGIKCFLKNAWSSGWV